MHRSERTSTTMSDCCPLNPPYITGKHKDRNDERTVEITGEKKIRIRNRDSFNLHLIVRKKNEIMLLKCDKNE